MKQYKLICLILLIFILVSIVLATFIGSANINFAQVLDIYKYKLSFFDVTIDDMGLFSIIWNIRLPRAIIAVLVGGGLALTGCIMQALTGNVMAEPYTLGIQSGAGMFAAFGIVFFARIPALSFIGTNLFSFMGAMVAMVFVYTIASKDGMKSNSSLVLTGISVAMLCNAVIQLIIAFAPDNAKMREIVFWTMGGLGGSHWEVIPFLLIVVIAGFIITYLLAEQLNIISMGEETAIILGISLEKLNKILLVTVSVVVGTIVSISGSIGFVGLIIPHIVRKITGSDHKKLIPVATLTGALFLVWADIVSRVIVAPKELPIGVLTSLVGVPFFLFIIKRKSQGVKK